MISPVTNAVSQTQVQPGQSASVADIKPQKTLDAVELPLQAVKSVEKVDIATVKRASEQINKFIQQFNRNLQFTVDEDTGINVVQVIDSETEEVIRQMPSEEMLAIARALDKFQGLLLRDKA